MLWVQRRKTLPYLLILPRGRSRCATDTGLRTAGFMPWMIAWFGPVIDPASIQKRRLIERSWPTSA